MENRNELRHYGVLGMKWGVRRYQNKDGSYTEAGKKRNLKRIEKAYVKGKKNNYKDHNSGEAYRKLVRKYPDIGKTLDPYVKATRKYLIADEKDRALYYKEVDKLTKEYTKKHGKRPTNEVEHELKNKAFRKVRTPNTDAVIEEWRTTGRNAVDKLLGEYGDKKLESLDYDTGRYVVKEYVEREARLLNEEVHA